jgi:hypothetical protein
MGLVPGPQHRPGILPHYTGPPVMKLDRPSNSESIWHPESGGLFGFFNPGMAAVGASSFKSIKNLPKICKKIFELSRENLGQCHIDGRRPNGWLANGWESTNRSGASFFSEHDDALCRCR